MGKDLSAPSVKEGLTDTGPKPERGVIFAAGKARALLLMNTLPKGCTGGNSMKNLLTTKCPNCGTEINGKHMKPPFIPAPADVNFYGGRVKKMMAANCDCGLELIAYLEAANNGYRVIDLAYKNEPEEKPQETDGEKQEVEEQEQEGTDGESKEKLDTKTLDVDTLERPALIKLAGELGIEGKIATMKTVELKEKIKEVLAHGKKMQG
jgi:hypothetical protein